MEIKTMRTIDLKGKKYSPVSARVEQFHKDHADGNITTSYEFKDGYVIFKATVFWRVPQDGSLKGLIYDRTFTGHAFGKIASEKAFEKIESVSVGRALAMAGYLAGGEIASYDEMEDFVK
jgi:hypothetical protein